MNVRLALVRMARIVVGLGVAKIEAPQAARTLHYNSRKLARSSVLAMTVCTFSGALLALTKPGGTPGSEAQDPRRCRSDRR
jgi:hypothetical protein